MVVGRAISGVAGAVVLVGSLAACKALANNDEAAARENAAEVKRIQDGIVRGSYDQCFNANVKPLQDKAVDLYHVRKNRYWEKQYRRCVEFFAAQEDENQDGNCGTID